MPDDLGVRPAVSFPAGPWARASGTAGAVARQNTDMPLYGRRRQKPRRVRLRVSPVLVAERPAVGCALRQIQLIEPHVERDRVVHREPTGVDLHEAVNARGLKPVLLDLLDPV